MYPHGAHPSLTPSLSRPRVVPIPASLPVPLHVTSSRKVHRSADGIINIIQEIWFYAEGGVKSQAGKQLKEVYSDPAAQERALLSAETSARVFVGERLIRMLISTSIRPNTSDSLEIEEVFHFAEDNDTSVVPIAFEATLERAEREHPAVEFDLQSRIAVALKQRILKEPGQQYKVLQAIELRANESETRPIQELARKSTISHPTNDAAQFRERIFAGTDVLRVDRDIIFVCDRPTLSLSERREYMPSYPVAPRRRSASLTQSAPRDRLAPNKPRSRSQSRSLNNEDSENCRTVREDLPTATSPYSLRENESNSRIPQCAGIATARDASSPRAFSPCLDSSSRAARSTRKKWTVNSDVSRADARTPERNDRARVIISTARNLSPALHNRAPDQNNNYQANGEIPAIPAIPIEPTLALGPHGECQLVEGMEVLKVAAPDDSLIRTSCAPEECSPRRSSSDCSTAGEIRTAHNTNRASDSPPFSSPRRMPGSAYFPATPSRQCTPLRTALDHSPCQQRAPSSAALDKRRVLFGYGTRPTTTPTRSAVARSPSYTLSTGHEVSPMRKAQRVVMSPVRTAIRVQKSSHSSQKSSPKSQKQSHKESKRSGRSDKSVARPRPIEVGDQSNYRTSSPSNTNLRTARNLFGSVSTNESVEQTFAAPRNSRTPTLCTARDAPRTPLSPATLATARAHSIKVSPEAGARAGARIPEPRDCCKAMLTKDCGHKPLHSPKIHVSPGAQPLGLETWEDYRPTHNTWNNNGLSTPIVYPDDNTKTARAHSHRDGPKIARSPAASIKTARPHSPYEKNVQTARESRSPAASLKTARHSPYEKTARDASFQSPAHSLKTARQSPYDKSARSPALMTARHSPYEKTVQTAREARSPALLTAIQPHYENKNVQTARESRSPAPSLRTARNSPYDKSARSPALNTATLSLYEQNVLTARAASTQRSPLPSLKTARHSPYEKTAREASHASPARGLPTARGHMDGRSPALKTAAPRSPSGGPRSLYLAPAMVPLNAAQHEQEEGTFTQIVTARAVSPAPRGAPRSLYLAPEMALENQQDDAITQTVTATAVSPAPRDLASPLRPSMTARDQTSARSPHVKTARDALHSTQSCVSGGVDTNARWTAPSTPRSPMMATSRDASASTMRTARAAFAAAPTPTDGRQQKGDVMQQLPSLRDLQQLPPAVSPHVQHTAIYGGGMEQPMVTSRTQSPATRSSVSNVVTAQGPRSPHVETGSPTNLLTARHKQSPSFTLRTGHERSRGPSTSPANLRTARDHSTPSQSPASRPRTAATRTPEHNTMPDSQLRQEDSYSEQSQFTFQMTPSGYTQKPTHSSQLTTGQQRTPTKTDNNSLYYSARQTTPSRTLRPDDVTLTKRTPKRDFSQHAGLEARSPLVRTAVDNTPSKQQPKCSLKSGCKPTHAPRIIPAGPDSDKDSPSNRTAIAPKTPERSLRTACDVSSWLYPSAPFADMRTPRTARGSVASPASSLLRSPAPSSHMMTAVSPDAASNSNNSNEEMATAQRPHSAAASPRPTSAARRSSDNWAAATTEPPAVAAATKPRVIVRANQSNGKIHVEVCLSFKLNTTGTIRVRGEMASVLHPRSVSVNGQQIWSDSSRR